MHPVSRLNKTKVCKPALTTLTLSFCPHPFGSTRLITVFPLSTHGLSSASSPSFIKKSIYISCARHIVLATAHYSGLFGLLWWSDLFTLVSRPVHYSGALEIQKAYREKHVCRAQRNHSLYIHTDRAIGSLY